MEIGYHALLVIKKEDPKQTADLYLYKSDFKELCELLGTNRVTVVLRIKGVG